jgi:CRP-like cAMP-binding protein
MLFRESRNTTMLFESFADNLVLRNVSDDLLKDLYDTGEVLKFDEDQILAEEGQALDFIYFILNGQVEVYLPESHSRFADVHLGMLRKGRCFGEYAFLDQLPASASVKSATPCTVLRIHSQDFEDFLMQNLYVGNLIYRNLLALLVERSRLSNSELDLFRPMD